MNWQNRALAAELRVTFYESIMAHQGPHGRDCKIAKAAEVVCCNPACNGTWGTGCWCCHFLIYAEGADEKTMEEHLVMAAKSQ
jgi:hypothetical protein